MTKTTSTLLITGLIILWAPITLNAQLLKTNELFPNTRMIKGKYYNGCGRGFWSLDYVDSLGRVIGKESYRKKQLMEGWKIVYDENNNKILEIKTFDINDPKDLGTYRYQYQYSDSRIIYQCSKSSKSVDSTVIKLVDNQSDTLFRYQEKDFYYRPKTQKTDVFETIYTLRYQDGILISKEEFDKERNTTEITRYEYYDNGKLKRRQIERIPPELESIYVGGPGSDDISFAYKFDTQGRVRKSFLISNGKKFKMAVYRYQ